METSTAKEEGDYVLGHSQRELERLHLQAHLVDPITRQYLTEAGIGPGMRVLDVGSGAGDVSFLAAALVGSSGEVVGVDRSATAVASATARAAALSLSHVTFRAADPATLADERPFDALIGRYVLVFQPDPVGWLRKLAGLVRRPGGIVLFHEPDRDYMHSFPAAPAYDRLCRWLTETYHRHGADLRMGIKLYSAFLDAGLPAPTMRSQATIAGGTHAAAVLHLELDQVVTLAAEMARLGVATAAEIGLDTLAERATREIVTNGSVIVGRAEIGAWARL